MPVRADQLSTTGIIIATTGVLFMKAETTHTGSERRAMAAPADVGAPSTEERSTSTVPACSRPLATAKSTPMARMEDEPMPAIASAGVMMRASSSAAVTASITHSGGWLCSSSTSATRVSSMVNQLFQVNCDTVRNSDSSRITAVAERKSKRVVLNRRAELRARFDHASPRYEASSSILAIFLC